MAEDFKVNLHYGAILRLTTSTADKLAENAAKKVQSRARRLAPKRTGLGAASITIRKVSEGEQTTYSVGPTLRYMTYQNDGTGPITPTKPGGVLAFKVGAVTVFARRTSGVPATHFMNRAAAEITVLDFTL